MTEPEMSSSTAAEDIGQLLWLLSYQRIMLLCAEPTCCGQGVSSHHAQHAEPADSNSYSSCWCMHM